jgi:hypothetical protein
MKHVFKVSDVETSWFVAESVEETKAFFADNYGNDEIPSCIIQLDDNASLTITDEDTENKTTKTCSDWAAEKKGLLCSTCV